VRHVEVYLVDSNGGLAPYITLLKIPYRNQNDAFGDMYFGIADENAVSFIL